MKLKYGKVRSGEYAMVAVEWMDAATGGGNWVDSEIYLTPYRILSVGFLTYEDKDIINLSLSHSFNDKISNTICIPKKYITKIEVLRRQG